MPTDSKPVSFAAKSSVNLSDMLAERLLAMIAALPPHAPLPAERTLCDQFGVSRTTMRTAIMNLVHSGTLYRQVGRGTFVSPPQPLNLAQIQIAVISPWHPETSSYYYGPILRTFQACSSQLGFALRFYEDSRPSEVARRENWTRGTGVLLWTVNQDEVRKLQAWQQGQTPYVILSASPPGADFPVVDCDNKRGSQLALEHLQELGHENIGVVLGPRRSFNHSDRVTGCREYLGEDENHWLFVCEQQDPWLPMMEAWRQQRGFSALYFLDLSEAVQWYEVARLAGVGIPDDVAVVAFDDAPLLARAGFDLTTVRQPLEAMASHAISRLHHALLNGDATSGAQLFPPELIVRGSTQKTE